MTAVIVVAIIGATATVIAAGFGAWAGLKQRKIEQDVEKDKLGQAAMSTLLDAYRADNIELRSRYNTDTAELRSRVFAAEQRVTDLTGLVNRCESDKAQLADRVADQAGEIERLRRSVEGA